MSRLLKTILCVLFTAAWFVLPAQAQRTSVAQIELGRKIFHDTRLSRNGTVACATCHKPERMFTDGLSLAQGINGRIGDKNTPTILTASHQPLQFWNGRTDGIREQSIQPLVNPNEMGFNDVEDAMDVLRGIPGYRKLFRDVYGDSRITRGRYASALAAYQKTKMIYDSPIQRRMAGYEMALDPQQEHGYQVMIRSRCFECHKPPLFTDMGFHNTGISALMREDDRGRFDILPQNQRENTPEKLRAWKTPTLLGVHYTGPYTHGGAVPSLRGMVAHYATGGGTDRFRDPRVKAIRLNTQEVDDVVYLLETGFHSKKNNPRDSKPALPR
jgi:cytochrome c peroxidase